MEPDESSDVQAGNPMDSSTSSACGGNNIRVSGKQPAPPSSSGPDGSAYCQQGPSGIKSPKPYVENHGERSSHKAAAAAGADHHPIRPNFPSYQNGHGRARAGFNPNQQQRNFTSFRGRPPFGTPGFFNHTRPMFNGRGGGGGGGGAEYTNFPYGSNPYVHGFNPPPDLVPFSQPPAGFPGPHGLYGPRPIVHPPPPPPPPPPLPFRIMSQIEFYFSKENLVRDVYLRTHMDAQGWVPMKVVAKFNMVVNLVRNTKYKTLDSILEVMQSSNLLEVQDDKIRRRTDWERWILPYWPVAPAQPVNDDQPGASQSGSSDVKHDIQIGEGEEGISKEQ